ncbi:MAG: exopolyphosphatase [Bacteroidia bacterium]|nr:exopolyphosphatase [Bacteroidia bacterium]
MKAVIDLGSNTFNLLIADVKNKQLNVAVNLEFPVKIGKGGIVNNIITDAAIQRALTALSQFKSYIDKFEIVEIKALATSAIRNASNGNELIQKVKQLFDIDIAIINGNEEAEYIYLGANNSFKLPNDEVLVMDIGGGSVEFIIGRNDNILWKQSFDIGAVKLFEMFKPQSPLLESDILKIKNYVLSEIKPLKKAISAFPLRTLIGRAGTFETLVDIVIKDLKVIPISLSKNAFEISMNEFEVFKEMMITSTLEQRLKLKGMLDFRAEYIPIAAILIELVIEMAEIKKLVCSNYSMKEGAIFSM